jgi:hypothetical protein
VIGAAVPLVRMLEREVTRSIMAAGAEFTRAREGMKTDRGLVPLEQILSTEELWRRPRRPPDYETENRALGKLVDALAQAPSRLLKKALAAERGP